MYFLFLGVPLDGKAMRLEVVNSGGVGSVSGGGRMNIPRMNNSRPIPYGGRYQRSNNPQQQRKPRTDRVEAKADDLDAEMDAYMAAGKKSEKKTNDDDDDLLNDSKDDEKTGNDENATQPLADGDDDINLDEEI